MANLIRRSVWMAAATCLSVLLGGVAVPVPADSLTAAVDPFLGTQPAPTSHYGFGFDTGDVYPGAVAPDGMLAWSPDTTSGIPGGYWYPDHTITGFSLTHFSGRGCSYHQDVPIMPVPGAVTTSPAANPAAFHATFQHGNESAAPGYYHVSLDSGVGVSLAATTRTGIGELTFPAASGSSVLINTGGSAGGDQAASVRVDPAHQEVTGQATAHVGCGSDPYTVYFVAQFDQPFASHGTWNGATLQPGSTSAAGPKTGAYLGFTGRTVQVRTAISYVSLAGARANLAAEQSGWSLDRVRQQTDAAWNAVLHRIVVSGGTPAERTAFYTALYHCFLEPAVFNDVDGRYVGFDNAVHTVPAGHTHYDDISGWDQYRTLIALRAVLTPGQTSDIVQSLVDDAGQGGGGLPRWEQTNRNSAGMLGDSPDPYIATAYAFGARGFDTAAALKAMDFGASQPTATSGGHPVREHDQDWLTLGYVPNQVAMSLEYAVDDWSIAQFATTVGRPDLAATYHKRAGNWANTFDPATGYAEPKDATGNFPATFDPGKWTSAYAEGNGAQYTWLPSFDYAGLVSRLGGSAKALARLDDLFTQLNAGPNSPHMWVGNEPSEFTPYAYDFAGRPSGTQKVVRDAELSLFTADPAGLPGNDDGGAISSWYVWSVLGLFPEIPGSGGFAVGSPLFSSATLNRDGGTPIVITGAGAAADAPYVRSLAVDGNPTTSPWLPYPAVAGGGTVAFTLSTTPMTWGQSPR